MADKHPLIGVAADLLGEALDRGKAAANALSWPDKVAGTQKVSGAEEGRIVRELAMSDPTYLTRKLDELAPKVIKGPDGQMYRPIQGMRRFEALVKEHLPEVWAMHVIQEAE